jgi:hypothetical protein
MPTAHCLTIEVKSDTAAGPGGAGYMVAFTLPANMTDADPQAHPSFEAWSAAVRAAVIAAGDMPFHADTYTRKVAMATLMHDLAELNRRFPLRIGGIEGVPAVQIHSTDPLARQIEIDFTDEDGDFSLTERNPQLAPNAEVREQGRLGLMPAARKAFPFDKPDVPKKPAAKAPRRKPRAP